MMRLIFAAFGFVVVVAAGLFWFQNQQSQPVAVPAAQTDKNEVVKSEPQKPAEAAVAQAPVAQSQPQAPKSEPTVSQLQPVSPAPASPAPNSSASAASGSQMEAQRQDLTTLAPPPLDPNNPEDVVMMSRPALVLRGKSSWDDGYQALVTSFARLNDEAKALNLAVSGRGVTIFVETDDKGFSFEAELPVASLPSQRPAQWPAELRLGATPEGKAIRFVHKGPYDEIDSTYEAITAYLDVKGIEAKETLIEEYISLGRESADGEIELYIYVQPNK